MTNQRDANQTRDTRLASALMRRAPYGQKHKFNTVHGRPRSTARAVGVEAGFGGARDAEMSGVYEAKSGGKAGKNWAEFNSGSVWNGYPTKAHYANSSRVDLRGELLHDAVLIEQAIEHLGQQTDGNSIVPDNASYRHGPMLHDNAITLLTGGAAAHHARQGGGGSTLTHADEHEQSKGCKSCGDDSPHSPKRKSAGMLGLFTIPFRAGKALHKAAFGTANDLGRTSSCHPDSYALHVGNTPGVIAGRELIPDLQAIEAVYAAATGVDEIMTPRTPSNNDGMTAMNTRRAQAHSATRGAMGSAHGARAVSSNVYGVGRHSGMNPQILA